MVEQVLQWPYKAGYNFEVEEIRLELYRLLNQFLAEEKLAACKDGDEWLFHAVDIVGHFFDVETQRILIQAAVVARIKDDNEEESRLKLGEFETTCGTLIENLDEPEEVKLSLREACNKIIHALRFHYDVESQAGVNIINPVVYLYGKKGRKEWKASLNIIDFVKHYINNVV